MIRKFILLISFVLPLMLLAQSPGGVSAPDFWVKSDDAGNIATAWKDHSANADDIPVVGTWTLSPADKAHNFHPYTTGYTGTRYFYNATSVLNPLGNVELANTNTSIFSAVRPTAVNATGRIVGIDDDLNASEPAISIQNGFPRQYEFFAGTTGTNFSTTFNIGVPNVFSAIANNSVANGGTSTSSGGEKILGLNGIYETTPYTGTNRFQIYGINLRVGHGGWDAPGAFPGDIMEVVWYNRLLTDNEQSRVNSYLAIKNGSTLAENYLAANSDVVWDRTLNNTYNNNIFGVARDNASALHQKQAASTSVNQKLVIGHGSSLFESNADNTNDLTDGQFLLVGDNGLKQSLTTPLIYTAGSNGETNFRFEAVWKVQNTNNAGQVTIAWPVGINNLYLVQSNDETFASGNTFRPMATVVTINGVDYNTVTTTLTDGEFFTFAGYMYAPGGVTPAAWYRADAVNTLFSDAGTTVAIDNATVQQWNEFNNQPFPLSQSNAALRPQFSNATTLVNFNPTVNYTAANKWLQYDGNTLGNIIDRSKGALFSAGNTTGTTAFFGFGISGASNTMDDPGLYNYLGNKFLFYPVIFEYDPQSTYTINGPYIGGGTWENGAGVSGNNAVDITLNGFHQTYNSGISNVNTAVNRNALMAGGAETSVAFQQNEMIVFPDKLTETEVNKVESYLAIKYGQTLSAEQNRSYLNSTGTVVWDGTDADYYNNVLGIARDNISALHQKQSKSVNIDQHLIIGAGTSLANTNADNTNTLTEGQFLLTGDNGLEQKLTTPLVYTGGSNGDVNFRFESVWKVQNTNSVGTVTIAWPKGVNNLYLVQSADETFASGNTFEPMATEVTINGVVYNATTATLIDGQFFTFAGFAYAPGGVAGPDFWIKSDDAGNIATAWKDQSLNEDNIPNVGGMTLSPADRAHNFHPYTTDYTTSKFFYNPASVMNPLGNVELPNTNTSIFSAVRPATAGQGRIAGIDDDTNAAEPGMSIQGGLPRQYEFFAGTTGTNFSTTFNIGVPNVFSAIANNSVANEGTSTSPGGEKVLGLNGVYETTPYTGTNRFQIYGTNLKVGHGGWDAPGAFPGDIMEVVWYNRLLTPNEQSRVNSYLAVKNGTTLNENYLSTTGNVVWDRTLNNDYNNNIFGIARENVTALHQKQAASTALNQKLVIGHGSTLFETNLDNTNELTEGQFLLIGDNGLKQSLSVPFVYTSGTNGEANFRFESVWKVQNTNSVGQITIAWPKGIQNLYLVQSADQTFATGNTFTPMTTEVTVNGVVYNTATVTLSDGQFFTFAGFGQAPAGVINSLSYWYRADKDAVNTGAGTDVTSWTDFFSGTVSSQISTAALPKYAEGAANYFNFNPGVSFTAGTQKIGNISVQTLTALNHDIFTFTKEGMASGGARSRYFNIGRNNTTMGSDNWDSPGFLINGNIVRRTNTGADLTEFNVNPKFSTTIPSIAYHTFTDINFSRGLNGEANGSNLTHSARGQMTGGHIFGDNRNPGTGGDDAGFIGHIGETIIYGAGNLSAEERRRVDSYMAIKYGITLGRVDTDHYLGSTASTTSIVWDGADNTAYNKNIFGVARADIGGFEQKVSKSVNPGTILTVATNDNYVLSNLDASRTSFTNDEAYILFGDNEATGETSLAIDPCTGETLDPAVSTTNRVWRVQTTNASDAVWLQADLNAYNFNSDIEMWVANDENFTTSLVKVSAASYASGIATFNALFPEGVKYIKFVGVVTPSQCDVCTGGTFVFKTGRSWDTLAERTNNVIASETIGTTDQGDLIVDMEVADPANVEYGPTSTPSPYGRWMLSRRYDNQNVAITHTIDLNQAVAGASFQISNVNTYLNNANRFTIQGYDCDGNLVLPKITDAIATSAATTYEIQDNEVVGTKPYRGLASLYSTVNVRFDRVIQSIVIIQEVDRTNARNTLRSLNIGDISFECAVPLPPTEDNVTMIQDFTQSEDVPTCLETTMRMRFVNNNCDTRTIDISQTLPAGLEFVEDTYNDSEFTTAPAYTYNANTFTLNGLELPSGTTYLYINVRSTAGTTTTYNTSSSFTVQETGNPYNSIDPAGNADSQVSFEASGYTAPALDVSYTVNATCLEEGTPVTYTLNFDNQEATAITGATLNVFYALGQEISSVTLNNGITGVHGFGPAGESYIEMTNVTIPTGTSSIDVVMDITSDIFTDEPSASSVFQLITEPGNACSEESPIVSNVIELTECIFCATPTGIDSDGDGIDDGCDLDSDNDGILNSVECPAEYLVRPVTTSSITVDGTITSGNAEQIADGEGAGGTGEGPYPNWYTNDSNLPIEFSMDLQALSTIDHIKLYGPWGFDEWINDFTVELYDGSNVLLGTENLTAPHQYEGVILSFSQEYTNVSHIEFTIISSQGYSPFDRASVKEIVFLDLQPCPDTDGDGIPDYLDLDSDNDGCLDALEGDGGFASSDLETAGGTVTVGFGSGALDENLCGDGTCVDADGIPTVAGTGQGAGSSQDASISNCPCYKPGLLTGGSILDTNIGITSLGRAGADDADNWPMVRKGGWIALESKTKGFVPNRVEFTDADSDPLTPDVPTGIPPADFVEGMMVYDNTNKCLKMYTTTDGGTTFNWYCISNQTCPD